VGLISPAWILIPACFLNSEELLFNVVKIIFLPVLCHELGINHGWRLEEKMFDVIILRRDWTLERPGREY
jgi:hypothetical protein